MRFSEAVEDYLKAIYKLSRRQEAVSTSALAERLGVSSAAVTNMLKRLARMGLVGHEPYQGVRLTPVGRKVALEVIRHHRLLERYLVEALGYGWDEVDGEAERLEHFISEEMEERIAAFLGHPTTDPHGDPIPSREGEMEDPDLCLLAELPLGQRAVVRRVSDRDAECLRYLVALGLVPGAWVEVVAQEPLGGGMRLQVEGQEHWVGRPLAEAVFVELVG